MFQQLIEEFLEATWQQDPVAATRMGVHRYDDRFADRSPDAIDEWGQSLNDLQRRFKGVDPVDLTRNEQLDRQWALAALDYLQVEHELKLWQRLPQSLLQDVGAGLHSLLIGDFAPLKVRLESVLSRLKAVPGFLETARQTLQVQDIPPVWIEASIPNAHSAQQFLAKEVPKASLDVPELAEELVGACQRAAQAMSEFERFLKTRGGEAKGQYAIGREYFNRILQRFHMLDMDSDELYEFGWEWISRYEQQMTEVASQIDPTAEWTEVLERIKDDHPAPNALRQAYEDETMLARRHCLEHDLITFPEGESCTLEWTPAFMRSRVPIAQPWVSPAFEPGLASRWYITPVDETAPAERQRQHIRDNSWAWIRGIAMHEIYPGHHLQFVLAKQLATPLRLRFWSPVFGEGWGLYTEELFYETGLLAEPKYRLMQLRNALWRAVRIIVDVGLHTRGLSLPEAARWLSERARLEPRWAESETRYYTTRPTYPSSYQVGFAMLLDLRKKYQAQKGDQSKLKAFHDELMSYSSLPLKLVTEEMLD
ncbi:MAG: DUF885 domain-containing protein [Anaerolineae bacterium]|jgi:uncharacterized protein (DUF885 family)